METAFWQSRWQEDRIGFHADQINPFLMEYWSTLQLQGNEHVFVPLCGKTLDMHWLAQQGHLVTGNEIIEKAVSAFFDESGLRATRTKEERFERFRGGEVDLLLGDFFALVPEDLEGVTAWYDRAAQVALPPEMRIRYYEHLASLLPMGAKGLSLAFEYPQEQKDGPPFSVEEDEIRALCGEHFACTLLHRSDRLEAEPRLKEQGLTRASEAIYLMERI
ncbi:MAG: thiopurine S-methyltransferase [Planctomycetota bacterium]